MAVTLFLILAAARKPPPEYRFDAVAGGSCGGASKTVPVEVQLAELERTAREMQRSGESTAGLTLGAMTRIDAVRWEPARGRVTITGVAGDCGVEPILLDSFVAALRVADAPSMEMSLEPERRRGELWHRVEFFPRELAGTPLLEALTRADYFIKALLLRRVETPIDELPSVKRLLECRPPRTVEPSHNRHLSYNVYLYAYPPRYELQADGTTVALDQPQIELRHGPTPSALTRDFARLFTARYSAIESTHPRVFAGARNAFMLYHVADLLRQWASEYDLSYWLREYPLERRSIPRRLPSPLPRKMARFCGSVSAGVFSLQKLVSGGALTAPRLSWNLPDTERDLAGVFSDGREVLVLSRDGGASRLRGETLSTGVWRRAGEGLVRVTAGERSLELTVDVARGLVDAAGEVWRPWGRGGPVDRRGEEARDGRGLPGAEAEGADESGPESGGSRPDEGRSGTAGPAADWSPVAFREIARVSASPPQEAADSTSRGTGSPLLSALEHGDLEALERRLERRSANPRSGKIDAFTRSWALSEVRAQQGDSPGALKAVTAAEALWDGQRSPTDRARFLEHAAHLFERQGRFGDALERYGLCRHVLSAAGLRDSVQDVRCLVRLAGMYSRTFDLERADGLFVRAVPRVRSLAEPRVSVLFDSALGWHRIREGRPSQALPLFARVLETLPAAGLGDPLHVAEVRADMARAHAELGRDAEAERLLEAALSTLEVEGLTHHPLVSRILNDLALARKGQGQGQSGELLRRAEKVLAISREHYGPRHPSTITALNNLAVFRGESGRPKEAARLLDTALDRLDEQAWEDFSLQATVLRNRAAYAFLTGNGAVARELLDRAVSLARHTLGPGHPETAAALSELAVVTGLLGDRDEANRLYSKAASAKATASDPAFGDLALRRAALRALGRRNDQRQESQTTERGQP